MNPDPHGPGEPELFPPPPPDPNLVFIEALRGRRTPLTYVFMVSNFIVFVLMELAGGTTNEATLLAFGVKSNPAIDAGEIWRFVTPVFIHIGLLHLALNSYALWIVGQQVERLYGSARFTAFYVVMGIAGVAGSYLYHPDSLSAGASGAIFGLFGVLLVFGIRNRRSVPPFIRRAIGAGILPVIIINLGIGFAIPVIDNAAHLGGLVSGMALAALVRYRQPGSPPARLGRLTQSIALAAVVASFSQVAVHYDGPSPSLENLSRGWRQRFTGASSARGFIDAVDGAQRAFLASRRALRNGADAEGLRPVADGLGSAIDGLDGAPSLSADSDRLIDEFRSVLEERYAIVEDIRRADGIRADHRRALEANAERYRDAVTALLDWVRREGAAHGLEITEREEAAPGDGA